MYVVLKSSHKRRRQESSLYRPIVAREDATTLARMQGSRFTREDRHQEATMKTNTVLEQSMSWQPTRLPSFVGYLLVTLLLSNSPAPATSFLVPSSSIVDKSTNRAVALFMAKRNGITPEQLKNELTNYLQNRKEANADQVAQDVKGKVVGGTRGNAVLDFVSGAPVKEQVIEQAPNVFDYDELSRYGFAHLVTPIMNLGGRPAVYELMDMEPPVVRVLEQKKKTAPKLIIDRTGREDKARYSGLKINQVLDDETMAEALERAIQRAQKGEQLRPKLMEEEYVQPFADKRNTGPAQTPDWTPERLDEYAKQQGRVQAWARRAKLGEFVKDPFETLDLSLESRLYAVATTLLIAFSFGRSTPAFLVDITGWMSSVEDAKGLSAELQIPGLALGLASLGSSVVCALILAPERNRNAFVWATKGLLGGPLVVRQLQGLETLITFEEDEQRQAQNALNSKN